MINLCFDRARYSWTLGDLALVQQNHMIWPWWDDQEYFVPLARTRGACSSGPPPTLVLKMLFWIALLDLFWTMDFCPCDHGSKIVAVTCELSTVAVIEILPLWCI